MAELIDSTVPYEILIRFDDSGALAGAHKIERRRVSLDGEVLKDEVGPAKPIAVDDADDPGGLWGVLGEALTRALARTAEQASEISGLRAQLAEASAPDAVARVKSDPGLTT
jgi:hypothetical protein